MSRETTCRQITSMGSGCQPPPHPLRILRSLKSSHQMPCAVTDLDGCREPSASQALGIDLRVVSHLNPDPGLGYGLNGAHVLLTAEGRHPLLRLVCLSVADDDHTRLAAAMAIAYSHTGLKTPMVSNEVNAKISVSTPPPKPTIRPPTRQPTSMRG